jgi:N-acetylmuramoyl-L-alanine amidase
MPRSPQRLAVFVVLLTMLVGCAAPGAPAASRPTQEPVAVAQAAARIPVADSPANQPPAAPIPTAVRVPSPTSSAAPPSPTAEPPPPTPSGPTVVPTPTPRPAGTPPRVGLQIGHLRSNELPEELARLRTSTGARWGDVTEAELNEDIANRIKPLLEAQGVVVDLLPATVPIQYDADAFIAIHADGSTGSAARGWKLATFWRASPASRQLMAAVAGTYGVATGLPEDVGGVTVNMRGYYAFNYRRHDHAVGRTTPSIIVEMGFMTNAGDRSVMFDQPDRVARGIADGILAYLAQRDPNNGAALITPEFPAMRAKPEGATLRAAPRDDARSIMKVTPEMRLLLMTLENGWYEVLVRNGDSRPMGYIRADQLEETGAPEVFPTPTNP